MKLSKKLLSFLLFSFITITSYAQSGEKHLIINNITYEEVNAGLKEFALQNDFFIEKIDREEGFFQFKKKYIPKGIFSQHLRMTINFLVSDLGEERQRIDIQIYLVNLEHTVQLGYQEEEIGMPDRKKYYDEVKLILEAFFNMKRPN
ncbi:hypothetical protein GCM10022216_01430 [Sphingobacterium kyonggiense]|uniref:DUF4468 domain-containing protein n=1 Tax=Sphingobacterium kyonggiense TaxID=714075 RepID=A0ABP7Y6H3_9SPHI